MEKQEGLAEKQHSGQSLTSAMCLEIPSIDQGASVQAKHRGRRRRAKRTGLLMVSVPFSLIQMAKFVRKLVELNKCGPSV